MLYYFNPEQNCSVKALFQPKEGIMDGFLTTEAIPEIPDFGEGFTAVNLSIYESYIIKASEYDEP